MFNFIKSKCGKYLYAQENPSIRADLNGNIYGGGIGLGTAALIGGLAAGGGAMYSAHQQKKSAESQQEAWKDMSEPQQAYMRKMYPLQLEQMQAYLPFYKEQIAQQQELLPYQKEMIEGYMPYYQKQLGLGMDAMGVQQARLPFQQKMFEEQYYPAYTGAYGDIAKYAAEGVQPWEKQAISLPFEQGRTRLGERAAGAGTLRAGATQKLATLYDIAESEALVKLPYQRKERAMEYQLRSLGFQPSAPTGMNVGAPTMQGAAVPGQIGVGGIGQMPQGYQPQQMDYAGMGQLFGMMGQGQAMPYGDPTGGVSNYPGGYQHMAF